MNSASSTPSAHSQESSELFKALGADPARGLSRSEAAARLASGGPNALQAAAPLNPWALLFEQFKSPLVVLLLGAAGLSAFLGEWVDSSAIAVIVILNSIIGFAQEYRAEKSIAALKKMTAPKARVLRDGSAVSIPAEEVVTGDVLLLEAGDQVAADARLTQSFNLRTLEAALTGESEAVTKNAQAILDASAALGDRVNLVFMGTTVSAGSGKAIVAATGMQTEIGHIARLLESSASEETPLQKQLAGFGKWVLWMCLGLVGVVAGLGWWRHLPPLDLFLTSVSLAVAAVPEGLPAVVTIAMALGVKRMARRHALIRRLPSVETLGSTEVICTDKTGTLTRGEMSVRELYIGGEWFGFDGGLPGEGDSSSAKVVHEGHAPSAAQVGRLQTLAEVHLGCNSAGLAAREGKWEVTGDTTEGALLIAGRGLGLPPDFFGGEEPLHEFPFDSDTKRRGMFRRIPSGEIRLYMNGAPDVLLGLCDRENSPEGIRPLTETRRAEILQANAGMAEKALRVIASAYADPAGPVETQREVAERDLVFAGLAGLQDPPRAEAAEAIARCHAAGIRVVMITGDHPRTALAIARELGLARDESEVLAGADLDRLDEAALAARVTTTSVYARVTAEHKLRIVSAWRARGAVVAMTGDGVNDAPALKGADIGIAMGQSGTEVTKQAADLVLADDNFASIVAAVEEGRGVYFNIRKTLQYLLAGNAGELLVMLLALAWGWPAPLLAVHLLWINLITDGLPALVLAADKVDASLMRRKPRRAGVSLTDASFVRSLLGTGLVTAAVSLTAFWMGLRGFGGEAGVDTARSYAFDTLVLSEVFRAFAYHSDEVPFWRSKMRGLIPLGLTALLTVALQLACHDLDFLERILHLAPWNAESFALMFGLSLIPMLTLEMRKVIFVKPESEGNKDEARV